MLGSMIRIYKAATEATAAPAWSRFLGDHSLATHNTAAPTRANRHDHVLIIAAIRRGTVTSVSWAIIRRLKGKLTRQAPSIEPSGTPTGPHNRVSPAQPHAVTSPSKRLVREILRW